VIGWGLVVFGLLVVVGLNDYGGVWFAFIGFFIAWLAGASLRQQELQSRLAGLTVERVMTPHPEYVDGAISVETLVHEHLLGRQHSRYPVIHDGAIVGVVSLGNVKTVPREEWPYVRVVDITDRDLSVLSIDVSTPIIQVLPRLSVERTGALLAVRDGRLAGIITRADIIDVLNRQPLT
jgi:CBS domain-containing protein